MGGKARQIFGTVLGIAALWATGNPAVAAWVQGTLQATAMVYGAWAARDARRKAQNAQAAALQDRKIMVRSGTAIKSYAYGRVMTSGAIAFWRAPQSKQDPYAWLVLAFPIAHRIRSIDDIWYGDESVTPLDPSGDSLSAAFRRTFTKTNIVRGTVPASKVITVETEGGFVLGPLHGSGLHLSVGRHVYMTTGDDSFQDANPDAVAVPVAGTTNQVQLTANEGEPYVLTYSYQFTRSYIKVWKYFGTPDQVANTELIAATAHLTGDDRWTSSDRLQGIPYLILRLHVDPDVFPRDLENISAMIQGKDDILDTRNGQTGYTANSMLVARDYAIAECGVLPQEINLAHFNAEVNVCEEDILAPDPNPPHTPQLTDRYTTDTMLSTGVEPANNLGMILSSCDGAAVASGSTFDLHCGHYNAPDSPVVLDDGDLAGQPTIVKGPERPELFNGVRGRFINIWKPFAPLEDFPAYISEYYKRQDNFGQPGGPERVMEIDLVATGSAVAAQRIAKQILHRYRAGLTVKATFNMKAMQLAPEQTIWLNLRALGMEEKPFRIKSMKPVALHQVELTMQEDGPLLYQWDFDEGAGVDPAPNSNLPSVRIVPDIDGLGADTGPLAAVLGPDGNLVPQCRVFWTPVADMHQRERMLILNGGHIEIRYKRTVDDDWVRERELPPTATEHRFPIQRGDVWIIEVRLANSLVRGKRLQIKRTTHDTPAPYIVSANELRNAKLEWSETTTGPGGLTRYVVPQWTSVAPSGADYVVTPAFVPLFIEHANANQQPGAMLFSPNTYIALTAGGYEYAESSQITVNPGRRMVFFAQVIESYPQRATELQVLWYTSQGAYVDVSYSEIHSENYLPEQFDPENWPTVSMFTRVPAGAYIAKVRIVNLHRQSTRTIGFWFFRRPFFGEAAEGQISLPPWRA